mmetsp:Transcript_5124/g.19217  ORF Transcript_5124/g.19217 Transcript_5124/m.19217 type:complete len:222 (+) Transcript_5124:581-1246(+)
MHRHTLLFIGFALFVALFSPQIRAEEYISAAYYSRPGCTGDITQYNLIRNRCIVSADGETSTMTSCTGNEKEVTTYDNPLCSGEGTVETTPLGGCNLEYNFQPLCGEPDVGPFYAKVSSYGTDTCDTDMENSYTVYTTGTCYNSTGGSFSRVNCAWQEGEGIAFRTFYDSECTNQIGKATVTDGSDCTNRAQVSYCSGASTYVISAAVVFSGVLAVILSTL